MRSPLRHALIAAAAALGLTALFRCVPGLADGYRLWIFLPLSGLMRSLSDSVSFPLVEVFIIFLLAGLIFSFRPWHVSQWAARLVSVFSSLLLLYSTLWGPLYACSPVCAAAEADASELNAFCEELIDALNRLSSSLTEAGAYDIDEIAAEATAIMSRSTGLSLSVPKIVRYPEVFEALHIAGMYFPFTFESLLNPRDIAPALRFTACHELAHQAGWAREEEASFIAWLACLHADENFQYSGHFSLLTAAMKLLRALDSDAWNTCVQKMNDHLLYDFRSANGLNEAVPSRSRRSQDRLADAFLRVNGQRAGLVSYDEAVLLAMRWRQENGSISLFTQE